MVNKEQAAMQGVIVAIDDEDDDILPLHEVARIKAWEESLRNDKTGWWLFAAGCCIISAFLPCKERYNNRHNRNAALASRVALTIAVIAVTVVVAVLVPPAIDNTKPKYGLGKGYEYVNDLAPGISRECVHVGKDGHIHVCRYPGNMGGMATARTGPDYSTPAGPRSEDIYGPGLLTDEEWDAIKHGDYGLLRQHLRSWGLDAPI